MEADFFGYIVASLKIISFSPQALKILRSRDTHSTFLLLHVLFTTSVAFWALLGWMVCDGAVLIANLITIIPSVIVLALKPVRYRANDIYFC